MTDWSVVAQRVEKGDQNPVDYEAIAAQAEGRAPQQAAQAPQQPTAQPAPQPTQQGQALGIGPQVPGTTPLIQEAVKPSLGQTQRPSAQVAPLPTAVPVEQTRAVKELPELGSGGLLSGEDPMEVAKIAPVLLATTDPKELGQILTKNFPDIGIQEDEQGNLIAGNNKTGVQVVINKPGLSQLDIVQGLGIAAAFTPAARAAGAASGLAKKAAVGITGAGLTETAIQAAQEQAGGEFDKGDIALTAGLGGAAEVAVPAIQAIKGATRPVAEAAGETLATALEKGTVMTSDVLPPDTFMSKGFQKLTERIPFIGTGKVRARQQVTRQEAVENIAREFDIDPTTPFEKKIVSSAERVFKGAQKKAARLRTEAVTELNKLGDVTPEVAIREIDTQIEKITQLGARGDQALAETLQNIKGELAGNFERLKDIRTTIFDDIADVGGARSPLRSGGDAVLSEVAGALSKDLDDFAVNASKGGVRKADIAKAESVGGMFKIFDDPQTGATFKTGEPVSFNFVRNLEKAPKAKGFQQSIEPSGRYMTPTSGKQPIPEGFEGGSIEMESPLVLEWNTSPGGGYDATGWKARLSKSFGGAKGKELSKKIADAGYDGVVTVDVREGGRSTTSEIVDLSSFTTARKPPTGELRKAANKWKASNRIFKDNFAKARETELKRALTKGKTTPEIINTVIKGGKQSELNRLHGNIDLKGRKAVRQQILNLALEKSGFPERVNPTVFLNELNRTNNKKAINTFFKGSDRKQLEGVKKFLNITRRAQEEAASIATQQEATGVGLLLGGLVAPKPILAAAGVTGLAGRAYESKPVRDLLIKLSNIPPLSKKAAEIVEQIKPLIVTVGRE